MNTTDEIASGPSRTWITYSVIVLTYLYATGVAIQFLLAGLGLFESGRFWDQHVVAGHYIGALILVTLILAPIVRLGRRITLLALAIFILHLVQGMLPGFSIGWIAAIHPITGAALFGMSLELGRVTRQQLRTSRSPVVETAPAGPEEVRVAAGGGE